MSDTPPDAPVDRSDGASSPVCALVVASDRESGRSIRSVLEGASEPLEVVRESDLESALERTGDVDCVVCERAVAVGWTDAGDLDRLRERAPGVPILCWGDPPETVLEAGVTDFVRTPVDGRDDVVARRIRNYGQRRRAERTATEYRSIFEQLPDAVVVHDIDGNYERVNPRASELLGYDRTELLEETTVPDIEIAADPDELEESLRSIEPGETLTAEGRNRRADGEEFPVRVSVRRLGTGDDDRFIAVVRDVSELRERERELARSLDLLERTEAIADAGGWDLDLQSDDLRWTAGTRRIHGVDEEYEPTLEEALEFYHPADRELMKEAVQDAIEEGTSYDETVRIVTEDGETRWIRSRGETYCEGGEPVRLRGAVWDVTDHKETEAELRQREAHLTQAQSIADIGSWRKDIPSDQIYWSDEVYDIFGVDEGEGMIDHSKFMDHIHPDDSEYVEQRWEAAKEGEPYAIEHRIVTEDGETKWVRQQAELTFEDGEPVSATGVVQDITGRKEYERLLEDQNEQLEVFNRIIRHDLRNQMNVIEGYASVLEDRLDDDASVARRIRTTAEDLRSISEEIRAVNRVIVDRESHEPVDLTDAIEEALETVRAECDDFECHTSLPERLWVNGADELRIALENVLENAVEHNDATRPRIDLTVDEGPDGETVELRIEDNGPGISDLERELVTGRRERTQLQHTSGIGIWVTNWIVSSVGGELDIETGDDGGTVVTIQLLRTSAPERELEA